MHFRQNTPLQTSFVLVLCLSLHAFALAEERLEQAKQLRDERQFDAALQILRKLATNMSLDEKDRAVAAYETGETLLLQSRFLQVAESRHRVLDEAQVEFERFVSEYPEHPLALSAKSQISNIHVERAKTHVERSKNTNSLEDEKRELAAAREHYERALQGLADNLAEIKAALVEIGGPLDPEKDQDRITLRDRLRFDYLQARILIPAVKEEQGDTFSDDAAERRRLLESAAEEYGQVHVDYRTRLAGLYSLLYQGRCFVKLDQHDRALPCFDELLNLPDNAAFGQLKVKSALLSADCWLDKRRMAHTQAIDVLQRLLDEAQDRLLREPDWLWLRVKLAQAYKLQADELAKDSSAEKEQQRKQSLARAVQHARWAAQVPGEHTEQARQLVTQLTGTSAPENSGEAGLEGDDREKLDTQTLDQARRAGQELLQRSNEAAKGGNDALQKSSLRDAIRYFKLALDLVETDTRVEDVNAVRYLLSYAYYVSNDFEKAAEAGEFLARRFPKDATARSAAKIAMAAYLKQYGRADEGEKNSVAGRLTRLCRHVSKTWPDDQLAVEAVQTLITFALVNDRLDEAATSLQLLPEGALKRGQLEIQLGQSLWRAALRESDDEKIVEKRTEARGFLEKGIKRLDVDEGFSDVASAEIAQELETIGPSKVSQSTVTAALSLCQIYVSEQEFAKAVALLEDKKIGPYTLVKLNHPATSNSGFDLQTLLVATRAYRGMVESDDTSAAAQHEAGQKLKKAILELDRRRKASDEDRIDIEVEPSE